MVNKKKSLDNWGRPRKQLIEGVKEVSLTVQLPETLIKALRKEGKKARQIYERIDRNISSFNLCRTSKYTTRG